MKYAKWPTFLLSFRQIMLSVNSDAKTEKQLLFRPLDGCSARWSIARPSSAMFSLEATMQMRRYEP